MSVKITKGTYGYVSCIIDDRFFNYCNTVGGKTIYHNNEFTADGIEFLNNIGTNLKEVYGTLLLSNAQTPLNYSVGLNMLKLLFPQTEVVMAGTVPVSPADFGVIQYAESSYFRIKQTVNNVTPANGHIITLYNKGPNLSDGSFGDNQQCSPFGYIDTQTIQYSMAVFNADKSDCLIFRFTVYYTGNDKRISTVKVKSSTLTPLTEMVLWYNLPDLNGVDPYTPGGTSDPTPPIPPGDFDNTSDPIPPAPLPTLSAVDAKFITMFSPDLTQLQALAAYMWGSAFDLDTFKKLFTDPMAAILGLSIVPVQPSISSPTPVTLGNITTTINMPKITAQYITVPCGTLNVNEYWGAYLDYSPYTKLEIFLPYIGIQTLDADDIMGRSVTVTYNIDILSGACVAMLTCGDSVLYSFAGSCATSVPITGRDWTNVINGVIGIATGAAGVAIAGVTGGAAVAAGAAGTLLGSTANSLTSMKPAVQKSGTMASAAGMLGHQKPYLILTRPRQALPEDQNTFTGYPSFITETLGNLSGFTIVDRIHLSGFYALDDELSEIETLLKSGVIL